MLTVKSDADRHCQSGCRAATCTNGILRPRPRWIYSTAVWLTLCTITFTTGACLSETACAQTTNAFGKTDFGVAISAELLERFVNGQRQQSESVSKQILGSEVTGCQTTVTHVQLKLVPENFRVRMEILSSGHVSSETRSLNSQAVVHSVGHHWFQVSKPVIFDGQNLMTQPGYGTIQAQQTPVRVISAVSGLPLIGPLADQVARQEVLRRSPQIDRAVAQDLSTDILPKVDRQADQELAELDLQLRQLRVRAASWLQLPADRWAAASQQNAVLLWSRPTTDLRFRTNVSDGVLSEEPVALKVRTEAEDIVLVLSQDLANRLLNQVIPSGLLLSDTQLNSVLESVQQLDFSNGAAFSEAVSAMPSLIRKVSDDENAPAVFSLKLCSDQPVQLRFLDGKVVVRTTFQVLPILGPASDIHIAEASFRGTGRDREFWSIISSGLLVQKSEDQIPAGRSDADGSLSLPGAGLLLPADGSFWSGMIQTTMQNLLDRLPQPRIPRTVDLKSLDRRMPLLRLYRIRASDGVLRISWSRADISGAVSPP